MSVFSKAFRRSPSPKKLLGALQVLWQSVTLRRCAISYVCPFFLNICPKLSDIKVKGGPKGLRSPKGTKRRQRAFRLLSLKAPLGTLLCLKAFGFSPSPPTARALWPLWAASLFLAMSHFVFGKADEETPFVLLRRMQSVPKGESCFAPLRFSR